ncbi:MAG: hypothetical protein ACQESR_24890 [Planctomycetota bacterium]
MEPSLWQATKDGESLIVPGRLQWQQLPIQLMCDVCLRRMLFALSPAVSIPLNSSDVDLLHYTNQGLL